MSGFWAGSVPSWGLVCGGCLCVLFLLLGAWFGVGRRDRAYDAGYDDGQADERDRAGVAMVKRAAMVAWAQTHPAELEPLPELPPSPAGYLRGLQRITAGATTNLQRDPDDPYDPDDDAPFTVREEWAVPLEYPPALHDCPPDLCPHPAGDVSPATTQEAASPHEWRSAGLTSYEPAFEPWSLSADTTLEEEIAAMIANADAAPSVRWLASLETGQ